MIDNTTTVRLTYEQLTDVLGWAPQGATVGDAHTVLWHARERLARKMEAQANSDPGGLPALFAPGPEDEASKDDERVADLAGGNDAFRVAVMDAWAEACRQSEASERANRPGNPETDQPPMGV